VLNYQQYSRYAFGTISNQYSAFCIPVTFFFEASGNQSVIQFDHLSEICIAGVIILYEADFNQL